ncbi:HTH_38 domain-containing protein [Trichonephila clavipes]|uniref:HTH_38 domain-containing protein n=1 Tax=Trichonephila clavipes TaxID=2585209 RepID=A0A8X7BEG9_TRICX|nr:HTH_38 domain-containing protein [Trichonephila clavipes]
MVTRGEDSTSAGTSSPSFHTTSRRGRLNIDRLTSISPPHYTRSAFKQVSEFDRGRIVAYRDCGLSFREIGSRVGRNQTTVMRICDRWMQEDTMD